MTRKEAAQNKEISAPYLLAMKTDEGVFVMHMNLKTVELFDIIIGLLEKLFKISKKNGITSETARLIRAATDNLESEYSNDKKRSTSLGALC